jgi:hypothetical protein
MIVKTKRKKKHSIQKKTNLQNIDVHCFAEMIKLTNISIEIHITHTHKQM